MRVVIVGTGTGVGKTHVGQALAAWIRGRGIPCAALKPIESGGDGDQRALEGASAFHVKPPPPYRLVRAVSPHLAAREQDLQISIERVASWVTRASEGADITIVETAGGLLSPLSDQATNADLVRALLPAKVLVVAPDRLGVLHDLRALSLACRTLQLAVTTTVLSAPAHPDESTGTNAAELDRLGVCQVAVTFPCAGPFDKLSSEAASATLDALVCQDPRASRATDE